MLGRLTKALLFNVGFIFANVLIFSKAFLGLDMSSGALSAAFGVTVIVIGIIVFFRVNYAILLGRPKNNNLPTEAAKTLESIESATRHYIATGGRTFRLQLNTVLKQIDRMKKRLQTVAAVMADHFSVGEMSHNKFAATVNNVERVMILNVDRLITRLSAFDEDEYAASITSFRVQDNEILQKQREIFNEYVDFVDQSVKNNEEILLRMDTLILEMSKLSDFSEGALSDMDAIKDIDTLIQDTKWYKQ